MGQLGKFTIVRFDTSADSLTDISTHVLEFSGLPTTRDEVPIGGFTEDHKTIMGRGDSTVTMRVKFNSTTHAMFTHNTTGINVAGQAGRDLTAEYGNNATPTTGDPDITASYVGSASIETDIDGLQTIAVNLRLNGTFPTVGTV
jgi:L,D-peptidoglycan transpeptidase YkuD (ErfK/YbiS/YcfS/YnhG family)